MADRRKTCACHRCGAQLRVPPEAQALRCTTCLAVTWVQQNEPFGLAHNGDIQLENFLKKPIGFLTSKFDFFASSINKYPGSSMPCHRQGSKRALLCGVSYRESIWELKGTINDVKCMRYFLVEKMGFPNDSILILTEDETDPNRKPTKQNIESALKWLVKGCKSGDSLVFHYSGHGKQQRNFTGDEVDGYDETLCSLDWETEGMILDDEINATIVRPLPKGVKLHAIIDACHSGTILDLPYLCRKRREGNYIWENNNPPSGARKGTDGGLAISFSACGDNQTCTDTDALSRDKVMTGAMTYFFIQAMQSDQPEMTYGYLLRAIHNAIHKASTTVGLSGPIAALVGRVFHTGFSQEPQLSSSEIFDIDTVPFIL